MKKEILKRLGRVKNVCRKGKKETDLCWWKVSFRNKENIKGSYYVVPSKREGFQGGRIEKRSVIENKVVEDSDVIKSDTIKPP